jgi:hypothetical protein
LSRALAHNTFVTIIDLSGVSLTDKDATALAFTLSYSRKLEQVNTPIPTPRSPFFTAASSSRSTPLHQHRVHPFPCLCLKTFPLKKKKFPLFSKKNFLFLLDLSDLLILIFEVILDDNAIGDEGCAALSFGLTAHVQVSTSCPMFRPLG